MYALTIKNARIYNGEKISGNLSDIVVEGGVISDIVRSENRRCGGIGIDAGGAVASIGLIDLHAHIYPLAELGVHAESAMFPYGVTSAADAGSAGSETFISGYEGLRSCRAGIKCFLNIAAAGLASLRSHPENVGPETVLIEKIKWLFKQYHDVLLGIKIRYSLGIVKEGDTGPLQAAAALARELGVPLMVHATNPAVPMDVLCSFLEKGDILSHAFHNHGRTILDGRGDVTEGVRAAKERGVIFDVGDAGYHFSADIYRKAAARGILPDIISGDFTDKGIFKDGAFCLPYVMTKFLHLGMSPAEVLKRVTVNPAAVAGFPARLAVGENADITLLEVREKSFDLVFDGERLPASRMFAPLLTVKSGAVVWRSLDFV